MYCVELDGDLCSFLNFFSSFTSTFSTKQSQAISMGLLDVLIVLFQELAPLAIEKLNDQQQLHINPNLWLLTYTGLIGYVPIFSVSQLPPEWWYTICWLGRAKEEFYSWNGNFSISLIWWQRDDEQMMQCVCQGRVTKVIGNFIMWLNL